MALRAVARAMPTAFVLLDAVPGMREQVFKSLDKLVGKGIAAKELVRADSYDIVVKVTQPDDDAIEDFIGTHLRFISGVVNIRRVREASGEHPAVQAALTKMR